MRHGMAAADWWEAHGAGVTRKGSLAIALGRDRQELDRFARRTRENRLLNEDELDEMEPDLAGRFQRALFFPTEAHLAPRQALSALTERLKSDHPPRSMTG